MHALLIGTGGAGGWPQDGCRCASCMRARSDGLHRRPGRVLVDGLLEFSPGQSPPPGPAQPGAGTHRLMRVPGGYDITGPDGGRLLLAESPGAVPEPPAGAEPYDIALLDLLAAPAQLGRLRAAGLVRPHTAVAVLYADHRITSEQELARRCALWEATAGQDGQLITSPAPGIPAVIPAPGAAPTRPHRTLITGGARSGKSSEAELRLAGESSVTYLAAGPWAAAAGPQGQPGAAWTGPDGEPDREWAERVARHQARRPPFWRTVESLDIAAVLSEATGAVLIDGIGTWLAGIMEQTGLWAGLLSAGEPPEQATGPGQAHRPGQARGPEQAVAERIGELIAAWRQTRALVVAVTDQVGSGLVPAYPAGRIFRDQLGWLNQRLAAESELNLLVVAGRVTTLPG